MYRSVINVLSLLLGLTLIVLALVGTFLSLPEDGTITTQDSLSNLAVSAERRVGGGGAGLIVNNYYLKPTLIYPKKTNTDSGIHVGVRLELYDASCTRIVAYQHFDAVAIYDSNTMKQTSIDEIVEPGYSGPLQRVKTNFSELTGLEKQYVLRQAQREVNQTASLSIAGLLVEPMGFVKVSLGDTFWWSVKPSSPGNYAAVIQFVELIHGNPIAQSAVVGKKTFDIEVSSSFTGSAMAILGVVGGILGALLASLPAWLTWFDKRKEADSAT